MHANALLKQMAYSGIRLVIILYLAILMANYLNGRNFSDFLGKTMIKVHAEASRGVDANQLSKLILEKNYSQLQELLDRNYSINALVITDCKTTNESCPGQSIIFQTNPQLLPDKQILLMDLINYPFVVLRQPSSSILQLLQPGDHGGHSGEVIGRVYSISTIPSFSENYRQWLRNPFAPNELWRKYLTTMASCLLGGMITWLVIELFLKIRRIEQNNARQREAELIGDADTFLVQLDEKGRQIEEQQRRSSKQFQNYIGKIKDLEQRLKDVVEYREIAEAIITDLEEENSRQSLELMEQLDTTKREKEQLQIEVEKYKKAVGRDKVEASRALSSAISTKTGTAFEQQVIDGIAESPKVRGGDWRVVSHFDVAAGNSGSRFIDCIVVSKDYLVVLEVKGYFGIIEAEGSVENSRWVCRSGNRTVDIKGDWGENPYHQVRDYVMNLMNLMKHKLPQLPVYGVVVFPEKSDISGLESKIGRFYRITTADRLLSVLGQMEAEARRTNAFSKRLSPEEIEDVMRGKKG